MTPDNKGRASLVSVITTPLGFFALALLIVEGFLGIILIGSGMTPKQKFVGMLIGTALFVLVVILVTILVWKKPESLTFGEHSYLEKQKMNYGDQTAPASEKSLEVTPKVVGKSESATSEFYKHIILNAMAKAAIDLATTRKAK